MTGVVAKEIEIDGQTLSYGVYGKGPNKILLVPGYPGKVFLSTYWDDCLSWLTASEYGNEPI